MDISKKSISTLKTSSLLLLVMTTVSVAQFGDIPLQTTSFQLQTRKGLTRRPVISEKIGVRKDGSKLIISIVGASGRYCGVFYKTPEADRYHFKKGSIRRIGRSGEIEITMDLKRQDRGTFIFQVFTADNSDFTHSVRGTSVFEVSVLGRKIVSVSRNGDLQPSSKVASKAATVGYADRKGIAIAVVGNRNTVRKDASMSGTGGIGRNKVHRER
jgi:hypothetical protein